MADAANLHDLAVQVQGDLSKLAHGLLQVGADPQGVQQVQQMAEFVGKIVQVLAQGPVGSQPANGGSQPEQGQPPQAAPAGPPQAAPQGAPQGAQPEPSPAEHNIHAASKSLQAAMIASKAQRGGQ